MKVLITGAAGKLGSHVAKCLHEEGYEVLGTDRKLPTVRYGEFRVINLMNRESVYDVVRGQDVVVHLGNHPNEHTGDAQTVYSENCTMNINVFQAAAEAEVKTIVYASSIQAVTGREANEKEKVVTAYLPADSDFPHAAHNPYSQSKVAAEEMLRQYLERKIESRYALRFPALLGERGFRNPIARLREYYQKIKRRPALDSFLYLPMVEAAQVVKHCIQTAAPGYHCYLPARPESMYFELSAREIIENFFSDAPLKKPIEEIDSLIDTSKITAEIGWKPLAEEEVKQLLGQ